MGGLAGEQATATAAGPAATTVVDPHAPETGTAAPGPDATGDRSNAVEGILTGTGWTRQDVVVASSAINVVLFLAFLYLEVKGR